jgi:MFS family permease
VLGSLVTGRLSRRFGVGPVMSRPALCSSRRRCCSVPLAGGGNWTIYACLFLAEFVSGFGVMLLDISANAITAALVPDRLRARVAGAYMVVNYGCGRSAR